MINSIYFILLLFTLFSITFEKYSPKTLNLDGKDTNFLGSDSTSYFLKLNKDIKNIKPYLKFSIKSSNNKNQIAILSETEQCVYRRKLLGMQPYGPVNLFINKKDFENNLFLCVQCLETNCEYSIDLKYEYLAKLEIGEQYSYYVNYTNVEMQFEIEINKTNFRESPLIRIFHNTVLDGLNPPPRFLNFSKINFYVSFSQL